LSSFFSRAYNLLEATEAASHLRSKGDVKTKIVTVAKM
jgi:hypothetical protein